MPTTESERTLSLIDYILLWAGMTIGIAGFSVGAQLFPGISPTGIVFATVVAYAMVLLLLTLNGDIGLRYGIPFTVYMRACFGYKGAVIPGLIRSIPCLFWFGFQTWVGALALNEIMNIFFGFSNLTLLMIIFAAVQIINAAFGLKSMAKFDYIAIPLLTICLSAAVIWLLKAHDSTITDILAIKGNGKTAFTFAVMGVAGGWITMALNAPDLARTLKRPKGYTENMSFLRAHKVPIIGEFLGLVIVGSLVVIVGMISGVLTGVWNPIDVMVAAFADSNVWVLLAAFATIIFAQWSTNTAANLMPPAYILVNAFPKINFAWGIVISGILGMVIMPWEFSDYLVQFQVITAGLLGPICGIMIADYYFIRKRVLNLDDFYDENGAFQYKKNYNLIAIAALVIPFAIGCFFPDYIFFVTLILSMIIYTPLMKKYEENRKKSGEGKVA
jgi:NCS1 family nucleobase:cation symporter-1